jgi:hypothetical protein
VRSPEQRDEQEIADALDEALKADHRSLLDAANVPSSAVVWWRAQMLSRREALETAAQPITLVQGIAVACAGGLTATAAGYYVPTFRRAIAWVVERTGEFSGLSLPSDPLNHPVVLAVLLATAIGAVLTPLALYFTVRED